MRFIALAVAVLVCATPAIADEIQIRGGGKLTGIIRSEEGGKITIEVAAGTATISADAVASKTMGRTKLHDYYDKAGEADTAAKLVHLANWARDNGLPRFFKANMEKALAMEPNNETARRAMGFTLHEGRWLTHDELMRARGMVKVDGRWISPQERLLLLEKELEQERREWEEAIEAERREWELRRERARQVHERRLRAPYGTFHRPSWHWPAYYRPYPGLPYLYKTPPNAWFWYRPFPEPEPARPEVSDRDFERAVQEEVERRVKEILDRLQQERLKHELEEEAEPEPKPVEPPSEDPDKDSPKEGAKEY